MDEFVSLCKKYGTDKHRAHHYEYLYSTILKPFRNAEQRIRLLEIGIESGASLRLWHDYLWSTHTVPVWPELFGIDIDQAACDKAPATATTFCGSQSDTTFLQSVAEETGGEFDIIIDDGSHHAGDAEASFGTLWPHLKVGGVYVIEDLEFHDRGYNYRKIRLTGCRGTNTWLLDIAAEQMHRHRRRLPSRSVLFVGEACAITKVWDKRQGSGA